MENEGLIRLSVFIGLFALFASLEAFAPRRPRARPRFGLKGGRWFTNWAIIVIDSLALRLMAIALPLLAVGAALDAQANGWGLFNQFQMAGWLELVFVILVFDFVIWGQHLISHKVDFFWRFHRVHHADTEMDVTTAIRFHPIEILLSMLLKIGLVYLIGPAAWAVVIFEILLNGSAMFNHANIKLPHRLDAIVRRVLVTPDMHRVHHSVHRSEHDSNYGFALSIWDQMFGTYIPQPEGGHDDMEIGLEWQDERPSKLGFSLAIPFLRK